MKAERLLAAAVLLAALGAAWAQDRSTLDARLRDGRHWLAWVEARERATASVPTFHLAVYDPVVRRLVLLHVPGDTRLDGRRSLERIYLDALKASNDPDSAARAAEDSAATRLEELSPGMLAAASARLTLELTPLAPEDEPAAEAARALKERTRRPAFWLNAIRRAGRGLLAGDAGALDPLLFSLELRRTPLSRLEPARLGDLAQSPALIARLLAPPPPLAEDESVSAELLNAAGVPGLASRAAKMLRFKGVDVVSLGAAKPRRRTMVYDRTGDYQRAARTLAALDCPAGRALTRPDASRVVDVSVELGADCVEHSERGESRETQN